MYHRDRRWIVVCAVLIGTVWPYLPVVASGDIPVGRGQGLDIKPPLPVWPSDWETITNRQPTFRINGRFQATRYRVELAKDAEFTEPVAIADTRVTDESGITPVVLAAFKGEPLADGRYYWRAFAGSDDGFWTPAANYRTFFVADRDPEPIELTPGDAHPRLLLRTEGIAKLKARIRRSDHLRRGWQHQVNTAFSALELEPPGESYARSGEGQHGSYSTAAAWYHRHLENVAFVAFVTGNRRLAEKGVEMLMAACGYERWLGPLFDRKENFDPPWNSALETAMMTEAVAIGYDLLYPHLTDEQRETVRQALAEKGVRKLAHDWADPVGCSRIPRHQQPSGNWVMVCACSGGIGALAMLGEHPEAAEWARLVRNRARAWLEDRGGDWYVDNPYPRNRPDPIPVIGPSEPNFGIDGGYKESIGYMNYGTRYVCFFADALRQTTGEDLFTHIPEGILGPMAWSIMGYPAESGVKSAVIDFGDNGRGTAWYHDLLAVLVANRRDPQASWLYRRTVPVPTTPRSLLWFDDAVVDSPPDTGIPMGVFRGIGQVIMRSGWSPNTPMAAIKFHQNRGHLDIGTFYLFGDGGPTIIDSGVTSYGSEIYRDYSSKSVAHNLVLVDNNNQRRANGKMLAAVGTSKMTAAAGQLAAAYPEALQSWTRDLLMMPDGVAVIHDRLEGKGGHRFDLVLHPEAPHTLTDAGEVTIGKHEPGTLVSVHSDGKFTVVEQDGYHATLPRKYVRFNAEQQTERRGFLTVCRWPTGRHRKRVSPTIEMEEPGRWRIESADHSLRWSVCAGGLADGDSEAWLVSDARLSAAWESGQRAQDRHAIVLEGRRLTVDGRELMHATRPVNAAIESGLPLRAQFRTAEAARVTLAVDKEVRDVYLNGERITPQWSHGSMALDIPAGESELLATEFDRPIRRLNPLSVPDLPAVSVPDARSHRPDIRTRVSTCWSDGLDALDGDPNTAWVSLPGVPMPQWIEVQLPRPEPMSRTEVGTDLPCEGRVDLWDPRKRDWREVGKFETNPDAPLATVSFDRTETDRFRVVVERIDPANTAATIYSLSWDAEDQRRP